MPKQQTSLLLLFNGEGLSDDLTITVCESNKLVLRSCMQSLLALHHAKRAGVQTATYDAWLLCATLIRFRVRVLVCCCRPFLLPCLVSAAMAFLAWLSNLFMMSETHPKFSSKYTQLSETDPDASSPSHKLLTACSAPQELQLSMITHHKSAKQSPKHSSKAATVPCDSTAGRAAVEAMPGAGNMLEPQGNDAYWSRDKAVHFESSQSATQESQLQLSGSSSGSSGILAVRSASAPLDSAHPQQRADLEGNFESQPNLQRAQRPQPRPSLELVLPDTGMDSDMGAVPASLEAAAQKLNRKCRPDRRSSFHSSLHNSKSLELSPEQSSTDLGHISEDEFEREQLLPDGQQMAHEESAISQDHVIDIKGDMDLSNDADKPWYKQSIVTICLGGGGLITLFMNYLDELAPIFASAQPSAGGLGMPEHEFAWPLTFGGLVLMLYSLFLYPKNQKRWGYKMCCKIGLLMSIPSSLILPFAHTFVQLRWFTQACMFVGIGVRSIAKIMALASSTIIINTIAPMKQIGSVNGASQTLNALARAIGPFVAGIAWGYSADSNIPGKQYLPFLGSVVGVVVTDILYMYIVLPD